MDADPAPPRLRGRPASSPAQLAEVLAGRHPDELTTEFRKAQRGGRILVDVLRNRYAQTAVSTLRRAAASGRSAVATPIEWEELSDSKLRPDRWSLRTLPARAERKGDPWAAIADEARGLSQPRRALAKLARAEGKVV